MMQSIKIILSFGESQKKAPHQSPQKYTESKM